MCYVSVCPVFLHRDWSFCCGIVTAAASHVPFRTETCYDWILVCLELGLCRHDRSGQEKRSCSGCPWNASYAAVGSSIVMENVCPSQTMIVT